MVTDTRTGEPIPYANVYFAYTTLGSSTQADGTFLIKNIPKGKYDLLVDVVGYHRHRQPIEFEDQRYQITIRLVEDTVLLDPVTVHAAPSDQRYLPVFFKYFVGQGKNARDCKILNPKDLYFSFDDQTQYLSVHAMKPIQIINPSLGYTVHYALDRFGLDFKTGAKIMVGTPRFEELTARKKKDSVGREKRRDKAYHGSLYHLMKSLYSGSSDTEKFKVSILDTTATTGEVLHPFPVSEYLIGKKIKQLRFNGVLKVEYQEAEDWEYPGRERWRTRSSVNPKGLQQTYMKLRDPSIDIYENGYFADQSSVYLTGYLVWKETVSNMVPLGHELVAKNRARKGKRK